VTSQSELFSQSDHTVCTSSTVLATIFGNSPSWGAEIIVILDSICTCFILYNPPEAQMSGVYKQAPRPAKPAARYRTGKAPKGVVGVDSDSDAEDIPLPEEESDVPIGGEQDIVEEDEHGIQLRMETSKSAKAMNVSLKDVNISKDGKVTVAGREESGRTAMEDGVDYTFSMTCELTLFKISDFEGDESEEDEKPRVQGRPGQKDDSDEV
jgi:hypothetical protein